MDRRHDLFQDQIGCVVMIFAAGPALYWLWRMIAR